jgi:predicted glycosyltransferase
MKRRVLFYSHDSFGLGHFRRSLTIASYLVRHIEDLTVLMLTGLEQPAAFEAPPGIDFVKLPSIWKAGPDTYRSRHLRVSFSRVRRLREHLVRTVARAFDPALLIVDNVPRGVDGELLPTLRYFRRQRPYVRTVLTLRDVLDTPAHIIPQWRADGVYHTLERLYDEIWIAGCRSVFDPTTLYEMPRRVAARAKFTGYVVRAPAPGDAEQLRRELRLGPQPLVVVSCGGGGDGARLVHTYLDAVQPLAGVQSAVFLGPDMPHAERRALKQRLLTCPDRFLAFDFRPDLVTFFTLAQASVSMAGYNTTCELLDARVPALVVPRTTPRLEQLLRAEAFAAHGLLRVLRPEQLAPETLREALRGVLGAAARPNPTLPPGVDFAGLSRIARRVRKHLGAASARAATARAGGRA